MDELRRKKVSIVVTGIVVPKVILRGCACATLA